MGFIRGARQDPRYAQKQSKELASLPSSTILSQPVDLANINLEAIQAWLDRRVEEVLGGVEDEILAGMIGNVLVEHRERLAKVRGPVSTARESMIARELQHTLGPFLSEELAKEFMEELWILLLDAQETSDGLPAAWGPSERASYTQDMTQQKAEVRTGKEEKIMLGSSRQNILRSPERVIGRFIEDVKADSSRQQLNRGKNDERDEHDRMRRRDEFDRRRDERRDDYRSDRRTERYYDMVIEEERGRDRGRDRESERGRDRTSERGRDREAERVRDRSVKHSRAHILSPERTPPRPAPLTERASSVDTYGSSSPSRSRSRSESRPKSRSRSRSPKRKHHHHKKRKHHSHHKKRKHRHHKRRRHSSRSASPARSESHSRSPRHRHRRDRNRNRSASPIIAGPEALDTGEMSQLELALRQKALESVRQAKL